MTVIAGWLTQRGDPAGGQTRAGTRVLPLGTMWPTGAMTARQGVIPGGDPMAVTGSGMTVTVGVGRAVVQGSAAAGAYPVAVTAPETVTVANGDASNPRRDLVGLRVYDSLVDASGLYIAQVEILQGAAAPSPVDPTPPAGAVWLPLARLRIPAGASAGSPPTWASIIDDLRPWTVAAGGVLPDPAGAAPAGIADRLRLRGGRIERDTGSAWVELERPSALPWGRAGYATVAAAGTASTTTTPKLHPGLTVTASLVAGRRYRIEAALSWYAGATDTTGLELQVRQRLGTTIAADGTDSALVPNCRTTNDSASLNNVRDIACRAEINSPGTGAYTFGGFTFRTFGSTGVTVDGSPASLSIDDVGPAV